MALTNLIAGWKTSSIAAKLAVVAAPLVIVAILIIGTIGLVSHYKDSAYQKREAQREAERGQMEDEKAQLRLEKQKALTEAAEATAQRDIYKQVAESKRNDRAQTVKELEAIETEHAQHKAEVEAAGGTMSDSELADELCKRLAARGYPPCPR